MFACTFSLFLYSQPGQSHEADQVIISAFMPIINSVESILSDDESMPMPNQLTTTTPLSSACQPRGPVSTGKKRKQPRDARRVVDITEEERCYFQTQNELARALLNEVLPLAPLARSVLQAKEKVLQLQARKLELEIEILNKSKK